jgi:hypothetical protein
MGSIIYLLYVMGGFICNISLLYANPLSMLCENFRAFFQLEHTGAELRYLFYDNK